MIELQFVDVLADDQTPETPPSLSEIRFGPDESFVIPFTRQVGQLPVHWFETEGYRGFYGCDGTGCLLCEAGISKTDRYLIPFYSLDTECVGVAMVLKSNEPKSFYPQFKNLWIPAEAAGQPLLLTVKKQSDHKTFSVKGRPVPPGVDDGAAAIAKFKADLEAKKVDLTSIIQRIPATEFAELPLIARRLKVKEEKK